MRYFLVNKEKRFENGNLGISIRPTLSFSKSKINVTKLSDRSNKFTFREKRQENLNKCDFHRTVLQWVSAGPFLNSIPNHIILVFNVYDVFDKIF